MIMDGRKRIELRLHKTRQPAFGKVRAGDRLFLKQTSYPVTATATVEKVSNFENLTPEKILEIKRQYNHDIAGPDEYWQNRMSCKFCFLVWLKDIKAIWPVPIAKKDWRAWVVLEEGKDFGLLGLDRPG